MGEDIKKITVDETANLQARTIVAHQESMIKDIAPYINTPQFDLNHWHMVFISEAIKISPSPLDAIHYADELIRLIKEEK